MDKVVAQVYETTDYSKFKKLEANRKVTTRRVERLVKSLSIKELLNPILVNGNMEIIDGQGRFEAKKFLKRPVQYIIDMNANLDDCRRMNLFTKKWELNDSVESYVEQGDPNYIRLRNIEKRTGLNTSRILRMANKANGDQGTILHEGRLIFTEKDQQTVLRIKGIADDICEALTFSGRLNNAFFTGVKVMAETNGYIHEKMITNCKACRHTYSQMSRLEDQLKEFSRIYNYNCKKKENKLHFEDYMRNKGANVRNYDNMMKPRDEVDVSTLKTIVPESGNSSRA